MSSVLLLSIVIRLLALGWALALLRRLRDWRLGFLAAMLALMALQPILTLLARRGYAAFDPGGPVSELPGFFVSLAAFLTLVFLAQVFSDKRREAADLRLSEARLSKVFQASPDAIVVSAMPGGAIVDVNDGFTRMTGFSRDQTLGRTSLDLGLWRDPEDRQRMIAALEERGEVHNLAGDFRTRSGEVLSCLISAELLDIAGEPRLLTVLRDVTELKRAEEEREAMVGELETKNAELERFTYTVSHDLKSPLVTIRGFLGLLQQDAAAGRKEQMDRDVDKIRGATETMGRLLDELLELSRIRRLVNPPEDVALVDLAREAEAQLAGPVAERRARLEIAADLPVVSGDRVRLLEVLQNLIDNAVKFAGDRSRPRIEVGTRRDGEDTVLFVRDNGVGIDPRYHDKVFDLFERLDPGIEGTGVGLALVRRIVEVHGGRIWIESEGEGRGSTFCFTLPVSSGAAPS